MKAVALTDTGNIHGCHEFYKYCKEAGVKPILGAEVFVVSALDPKLSHTLVLLAKSLKGYKNILKIVSTGSLDNPGQTPKVEFSMMEELKKQTESNDLEIICLSGSSNSEIAYYILSGKTDTEIVSRIKMYQELF